MVQNHESLNLAIVNIRGRLVRDFYEQVMDFTPKGHGLSYLPKQTINNGNIYLKL